MTETINSLLASSEIPAITALLLGLLTCVSPCPLCSNVTAIGFISRDISSRRRVLWQGIVFVLGRTVAYALLGAVLIAIIRSGRDLLHLQDVMGTWGERLLAPALIVIGLVMLFSGRLHHHHHDCEVQAKRHHRAGMLGAFLLGAFFALSFCPVSALIYFGVLIPMSAQATGGYLLPIVFSLATSIPVLAVAWTIAYSMHNLGKFVGKLQSFQHWFNIVIALLFIAVGIFHIFE